MTELKAIGTHKYDLEKATDAAYAELEPQLTQHYSKYRFLFDRYERLKDGSYVVILKAVLKDK